MLGKQGTQGKAETLFNEALTGCLRVLGREHPYTRVAHKGLVRVLTAQGRARDAREVKAQYGDGL